MSGLNLTLNIQDKGNSAFADSPRDEVARILRDLAKKVEDGREDGAIHDVNGNRVGSWSLELPEEESEPDRER